MPAVTLLTMTSTPQRLRRSIRREAGDDRTYAAERTGDDLPGGVPRLLVQRSRRLPVRRTYDATVCATTWSRAGIAPVKSAATERWLCYRAVLFISIQTSPEPLLATTRSGRPSPLKSPMATDEGLLPAPKVAPQGKLPSPAPRNTRLETPRPDLGCHRR